MVVPNSPFYSPRRGTLQPEPGAIYVDDEGSARKIPVADMSCQSERTRPAFSRRVSRGTEEH